MRAVRVKAGHSFTYPALRTLHAVYSYTSPSSVKYYILRIFLTQRMIFSTDKDDGLFYNEHSRQTGLAELIQ